ncbi:MAG: dTDP-4-dehydrorhamnose reductase [Bacteroidaceae bacterium]|nr:dTDP-4-dehydrorhamnose reductase [Bacteroidaceae bacterium]
MRILVTGANGQLGNEMRIVSRGASDDYIFTDVSDVEGLQTAYLDITDPDAVRSMVEENDVRVIVNCAAYTNVDAAESNEALAERLNAGAPENLAMAMKEAGGLLIQISTDYVFGREPYNTPCRENQNGTPTGVYGLTKLHGEQKIAAAGCDYVIIRTAWLYSEFGRNFCRTMLNLTAAKPQLKVVFDQVGTPTYALDLAKAITVIIEDYKTSLSSNLPVLPYAHNGIYHFSDEGVCSWYDFTKMIQEYSGQVECDVLPCHSNEFPSPVTRPAYSVLDKTKIKEVFGVEVPYWTDSLKQCIENIKKDRFQVR